jgi:hypothetical protein
MVYFGQEVGERGMDEEGFSGRDGRTTIFDYWSLPSMRVPLTQEQITLKQEYNKVLLLCNEKKAIREGLFYDLMYVNPATARFNPDLQYAYLRYSEGELLLIVANFSEQRVTTDIFLPAHAFEYFGVDSDKKDTYFRVHIEGYYYLCTQL